MSNTCAIASAKGGVGKTTTVANIGAALAAAGEDVVVVDADIGMANLAATLGLEPDSATLHDVLAGTAALEDALYQGPGGLTILPGSDALEDYRDADLDGLEGVITTVAADHEYVLVDTGAGLNHDAVVPLELVESVLLVSTPQPQALGDTEKTRQLVERLGGAVSGLLLTRSGTDRSADLVDADVIGRIPDDPAVDDAIEAGQPVIAFAPNSPAAGAYRQLVADLFGVDVPGPASDTESATVSDAESAQEPDSDAKSESESESASGSETESDSEAEIDSPEESDDTDDNADDDADDNADDDTDESDDSTDESDDSTDEQDDKPASVGPRRTEDVPVSEAEPDHELPNDVASSLDDDFEGDEADAEESGDSEKSKGFFSRLLGR